MERVRPRRCRRVAKVVKKTDRRVDWCPTGYNNAPFGTTTTEMHGKCDFRQDLSRNDKLQIFASAIFLLSQEFINLKHRYIGSLAPSLTLYIALPLRRDECESSSSSTSGCSRETSTTAAWPSSCLLRHKLARVADGCRRCYCASSSESWVCAPAKSMDRAVVMPPISPMTT